MSKKKTKSSVQDKKFPLPVYKEQDDIYNKEREVPMEDEEVVRKRLAGKTDESPGDNLDIPGAELDDANEVIGEEDEENNYYSLGGDDHNDLEEDRQ
ncbi:MAG TPA: hypothetical protein VG847_05855 [Chitinophagaceae bacterium]|nr:hypothetical protein [Chitinophagaceae bacterium]